MAGAFAACQKESEMPVAGTPETTELTDNFGNPILNPVSLDFDASALTKVSIDATGNASWDEGDQILICCVDADGTAKYFTSAAVNLANGTFNAVVEDAAEYYAVYPCTMPVTLDGENFSVTFSSNRGICKSFKEAACYVAKTSAAAKTFAFKPITTVLECTVESEDVKSIYFRSMGAGFNYLHSSEPFPISFDSNNVPTISVAASKGQYITFNGIDGPGTYYISLPAVGETAAKVDDDDVPLPGFIVKYDGDTSGKPAAYYPNAITLTPGKFYRLSKSIDDQMISDYYVSQEGDGTGLSIDSPASFAKLKQTSPAFLKTAKNIAMLRDGANFHLIGTFTEPLVMSNTSRHTRVINFIGGSDGNPTIFTSSIATIDKDVLTANFSNITFTENSSSAFTVSAGTLNVANSVFSSNTKQIFTVSGGNVTIKDTKFVDNALSEVGEGVIGISQTYAGKFYLTNCIFANNSQTSTSQNAVAIQCAKENVSTSAFLGINNCLFYNNTGTITKNLSNLTLSFAHCIFNTTIIAKGACRYAIRTGAYKSSLGYTLLLNNVISNESVSSDSNTPKDFGNASSSYYLRLAGYNLYNTYDCSGTVGKHVVVNEQTIPVPTYTWTPATYAWTWNGSAYTNNMITVDSLRSLITEDAINGEPTAVSAMASDFMTWLEAQQYQNGNAFTVDLYGNSRGTGACWPGCYQNN